jgi:hypothetical protein
MGVHIVGMEGGLGPQNVTRGEDTVNPGLDFQVPTQKLDMVLLPTLHWQS